MPCRKYRDFLRGVRMFLTPDEEAMLMGVPVNNLTMDDLEALFALIIGADPRCLAPVNYRSQRSRAAC